MTTSDRAALAACLAGLTVLALFTGAALRSALALAVGAVLFGAAVAVLFRYPDPEDDDQ